MNVSMIELIELYARYSYGVDSRSSVHLRACFTDDAEFGVVGAATSEGVENVVQRLVRNANRAVVHHAFNIVVLEAPTSLSVRVRADFTMTRVNQLTATGHYLDEVAKAEDGTVRFRNRAITFTWRESAVRSEELPNGSAG